MQLTACYAFKLQYQLLYNISYNVVRSYGTKKACFRIDIATLQPVKGGKEKNTRESHVTATLEDSFKLPLILFS